MRLLKKRYKHQEGMVEINELTEQVIGFAMRVHTALGPGLLESAYKECLLFKLRQSGLLVEKEQAIPLVFEGIQLDCGYRVDLLVENQLVLELKSVDKLNNLHFAQVLTYLRLGNYKIGLLINFNVLSLKDGIRRVVNKL